LEIASTGRAAASRDGAARADPADEYPLWGAPRIHGELLKLGFEVAQSSVAKYMVKRRAPPSQGWGPSCATTRRTLPPWTCSWSRPLASIFDLLYALVIVRLDRRELVWINVTTNPTAEWAIAVLVVEKPGLGSYLLDCVREAVAKHAQLLP
jgi:hypothetical protein